MSDAKTAILARLHARVKPGIRVPPGLANETHPEWTHAQRIQRFRARMEAVHGEVRLASRNSWTEELKALLQEKRLNNLLYAPAGPLGRTLDSAWARESALPELVALQGEIATWKEKLFFNIEAAITSTRAGIAETGTLVLWPTTEEPRTFSLVPPVHIAVLDAENLYTTFEQLVAEEEWQGKLPTNVLLISGPSKTADIEQTLAYGVHGPTELIVLLVK